MTLPVLNYNEKMLGTVNQEELGYALKGRYWDYAMAVLLDRALPDVRDGMKPIHRKIMHACNLLGMHHGKPLKKSARLVGEVLGRFHPHGDSAVYDTMINMAQSWTNINPLVIIGGNGGAITGDGSAAMRYTEATLSKLGSLCMADLTPSSVDWEPNFDNTELVPKVLPVPFPQLLVNGSTGIAVGYTCDIPTHNLGEVCDATIAMLKDPEIDLDGLMKHLPGPDFASGGQVVNGLDIKRLYETGSIKDLGIVHRCKYEINKNVITVTEIPYQSNVGSIVEKIAIAVKEKKIEGITKILDETDRKNNNGGTRTKLTIRLANGIDPNLTMRNLFKICDLEKTVKVNMNVINEKGDYVLTNLKGIIKSFIDFRYSTLKRIKIDKLNKLQDKIYILEGLIKILDDSKRAVELIRTAKNPEDAINKLMKTYSLNHRQAKYITDIKLYRLTNQSIAEIKDELGELKGSFDQIRADIANRSAMNKEIITELQGIKKKYGKPRQTEILMEQVVKSKEATKADKKREELNQIANDDGCVITLTESNYIRRIPTDLWATQKRNTKGRQIKIKEDDKLINILSTSNKDRMLCFTSKGNCTELVSGTIPETSLTVLGNKIENYIDLEKDERVVKLLSGKDIKEFIVIVTKQGLIKKVESKEFSFKRFNKIIASKVNDDDEIIDACFVDADETIIVSSDNGMMNQFDLSEVKPIKRTTFGRKSMILEENDHIVSVSTVQGDNFISITDSGLGKFTSMEEVPVKTNLPLKGVQSIVLTNGDKTVLTEAVNHEDVSLLLITSGGMSVKIESKDIPTQCRRTKGVKLINLNDGDSVSFATLI